MQKIIKKLFTCCHPFFWLREDRILFDTEGKESKDYFSCVPLRVLPPSQKATHGQWEKAVKNNKSAKDYYIFVYHTASAMQGKQRRVWPPTQWLVRQWEPRERWRCWSCPYLCNGCIRMLVLWLSKTCGKDGIFPSVCFLTACSRS